MPAPLWEVVREVWDADGCLIDSTFQNVGITEQQAADIASHLNDLEEVAPTYEDGHRVTYFPRNFQPAKLSL